MTTGHQSSVATQLRRIHHSATPRSRSIRGGMPPLGRCTRGLVAEVEPHRGTWVSCATAAAVTAREVGGSKGGAAAGTLAPASSVSWRSQRRISCRRHGRDACTRPSSDVSAESATGGNVGTVYSVRSRENEGETPTASRVRAPESARRWPFHMQVLPRMPHQQPQSGCLLRGADEPLGPTLRPDRGRASTPHRRRWPGIRFSASVRHSRRANGYGRPFRRVQRPEPAHEGDDFAPSSHARAVRRGRLGGRVVALPTPPARGPHLRWLRLGQLPTLLGSQDSANQRQVGQGLLEPNHAAELY